MSRLAGRAPERQRLRCSIDYRAAKGALSNFCTSLSKEFGPRGVRVNTVSPGPVQTALL